MVIEVELAAEELDQLRTRTQVADDAKAVVTAAREYLRHRQLLELKQASGAFDFALDWRAQEADELRRNANRSN
jgi:hypothetical protein